MSIEIQDLHCGYKKDIMVLQGISMHVEKSKVTGVIGPNGSGKSTLLKTVFGYIKPSRGSIIFDGKEITNREPYTLAQEGLVYITQHHSIFPYMTVKENLEMGAWIFKNDKNRFDKSINEVFERFPILKTREKIKAGRLSGGEQRMLELGRGLMIEPKAILVDEPTAGLAPKIADEIYCKLEEIKEEISILLVDQNVQAAVDLSDFLYVFKNGRILNKGPKGMFDEKLNSLVREWLL